MKEFENGDEPTFPEKRKEKGFAAKCLKWFRKNVFDIHLPEIESWPLFFVGCCFFVLFFSVINWFEQESIKAKISRKEREERKEKKKAEKREKIKEKRRAKGLPSDSEEEDDNENEDKED